MEIIDIICHSCKFEHQRRENHRKRNGYRNPTLLDDKVFVCEPCYKKIMNYDEYDGNRTE